MVVALAPEGEPGPLGVGIVGQDDPRALAVGLGRSGRRRDDRGGAAPGEDPAVGHARGEAGAAAGRRSLADADEADRVAGAELAEFPALATDHCRRADEAAE